MKKLIATALTVLASGAAYALPLGNPADASLLSDGILFEGPCYDFCQPGVGWCDAISLRVGYYGDFVFNRHMEIDHKGDDISDVEIYTNAAYFALNAWDRVDVFATFGGTSFYLEGNSFPFSGGVSLFKMEANTHFSWSVGARATLFECGCLTFGAEGQYFYTKPHLTLLSQGDATVVHPADGVKLKYDEWQVGAGVALRIWNLVPYAGLKVSGADIDFGNAAVSVEGEIYNLLDLGNRSSWGYAIGVTLIDCERMSLAVEARFPDEKALYVNGQLRF